VNVSTSEKLCFCGQPLHYSNKDLQNQIEQMVQEKGENLKVTVGTRTFLVPRHYIALHGIKGYEVANLGFQELN
jgi:hypothetical protein